MPQSGEVGVTVHVHTLHQRYTRSTAGQRGSSQAVRWRHLPPALLPVSFAQAKDWLLRQQKKHSEALHVEAVNEEAREVVSKLSRSLAEQPAAIAALLEQPARPASPAVPPPAQSPLGPEPVTDCVRAKERAEERARKQAAEEQKSVAPKKKAAPKKQKAIPPELKECQKRASARMLELGIPVGLH